MFSIRGLIRKCARAASAGLLLPAACAFAAAAGLAPAQATETALYDFTGTSGSQPLASLISDAKGALYGTTFHGGASGMGVVFKLTPPKSSKELWTETVLHSFGACAGGDGCEPQANVIFDAQGSLYGTAYGGGSNNGGVVFKLTPPASGTGPWTETILYNFLSSSSDGYNPQGGLIFDAHGYLYGTTGSGGAYGYGTVFRLKPPVSGNGAWAETILYSFMPPPDGVTPTGSLIFDAKGALYGTTVYGGEADLGTVYKLTPGTGTWTETVLQSFTGSNGAMPSGVILDKHGALYGATQHGGSLGLGAVFKLTPPAIPSGQWTEQVLYGFPEANLMFPIGSLILNAQGKLYGVTWGGGIPVGGSSGAVYRLTPPARGSGEWTPTVLYSFTNCSGDYGCVPQAGLMADAKGELYGTTSGGGPGGSNNGAVFRLVAH